MKTLDEIKYITLKFKDNGSDANDNTCEYADVACKTISKVRTVVASHSRFTVILTADWELENKDSTLSFDKDGTLKSDETRRKIKVQGIKDAATNGLF